MKSLTKVIRNRITDLLVDPTEKNLTEAVILATEVVSLLNKNDKELQEELREVVMELPTAIIAAGILKEQR